MTNDNDARGALTEAVERTIETIERQLNLIGERAPGEYLDKRPVVQSLQAHARRLRTALAAPSLPAGDGLTVTEAMMAAGAKVLIGAHERGNLSWADEAKACFEAMILAAPRQPGEMGAGVQQDNTKWNCHCGNANCAGLHPNAASAQQDEREAELLALLKSIRPQYGTVGSRDKDVTELRAKIDHAIRLLSTAQQVQADAGAVHPDHLELLRPFMSARDGRLTHSLTVYLREMADPEFAKRTHEARKRLYGAAAESDKRAVLTDFDERINAAIEAVEDQDNHAALAILRTMLAQHQTRQQDDRAAFEVIAKEQCLPLSRVGITYDDISTQAAWAVYRKARAAMSREQSGGGE